jgi:hypothetical protein
MSCKKVLRNKDGERIAKTQYYEIEGKMNNNIVVFENAGQIFDYDL